MDRVTRAFHSIRLNVDRAAAFLGVKPTTLRDWIYQRKYGIPVRHQGGSIVFYLEELGRWSDDRNGILPHESVWREEFREAIAELFNNGDSKDHAKTCDCLQGSRSGQDRRVAPDENVSH